MLCGIFWYEDAREKYCAARLYVSDVVVYMVAGPERTRARGLQCYSIFLTASPPPPPPPPPAPRKTHAFAGGAVQLVILFQ